MSPSRRSSHLSFIKDYSILVLFHRNGDISNLLMYSCSPYRFSAAYLRHINNLPVFPWHTGMTVIKEYCSITTWEMQHLREVTAPLLFGRDAATENVINL